MPTRIEVMQSLAERLRVGPFEGKSVKAEVNSINGEPRIRLVENGRMLGDTIWIKPDDAPGLARWLAQFEEEVGDGES